MENAFDKNYAEVYKYLYSKIVSDNSGRLKVLLSKAKEKFDNYSAPKEEFRSIRRWLSAAKHKQLSLLDSKDEKEDVLSALHEYLENLGESVYEKTADSCPVKSGFSKM